MRSPFSFVSGAKHCAGFWRARRQASGSDTRHAGGRGEAKAQFAIAAGLDPVQADRAELGRVNHD